MFIASKIAFFQDAILIWFNSNQRIFPWRRAGLSNYQIIISEVLLQRTRAETILKFYDKFIHEYPNWQALHQADLFDIEAYLKPIGLYKQKAKRLHQLATYMVEKGGLIPTERKDLDDLPFMGQYIANAVELQIFNKPKPLLDVNMARVLERFFEPRRLVDIRYDSFIQSLAHRIVNVKESKQINWAILDFSALICKAQKPLCNDCPLRLKCNYFISL